MTNDLELLNKVPGGPELIAWFGKVAHFHDAEILQLHLDRSGQSHLHIHTWHMTNTTDERGFFVLEKHVVVTLTFEEITGLKLEGFSGQNVIFGLEVTRYGSGNDYLGKTFRSSAEPNKDDYTVVMDHCFGLSGVICSRKLSIGFAPGAPQAQHPQQR
jgi:hypothetical protein